MRIFMGIVWFIAFFVVLYILFSVILGVIITSGSDATTVQEGMQAGTDFARDHARLLSLCVWGIFGLSAVSAGLGAWKRVLPGTKTKKEAAAN